MFRLECTHLTSHTDTSHLSNIWCLIVHRWETQKTQGTTEVHKYILRYFNTESALHLTAFVGNDHSVSVYSWDRAPVMERWWRSHVVSITTYTIIFAEKITSLQFNSFCDGQLRFSLGRFPLLSGHPISGSKGTRKKRVTPTLW